MMAHWLLAVALAAPPSHRLWVWKTPTVLAAPQAAEALRDFCQAQGVTEVYLSFNGASDASLVHAIDVLHQSHIHVEALISSTDADEVGAHRDKLLGHVRDVVAFNHRHADARFDGIHLDIEPQQRPENKGTGNLTFLPGLVDAYHAVRAEADQGALTVDADIQTKLLKGSASERRQLLTALPRLTLMMYEQPDPNTESRRYLDMAYAGLSDANLAVMSIGLRTPDFGDKLPEMLAGLDQQNRADPHYAGWARHAYNDVKK